MGLILLPMLAIFLMPSTSQTASIEQEIVKTILVKSSQSMMDKVTRISYVSIVDNKKQPHSKLVTDVLNELGTQNFMITREMVDSYFRFFAYYESGIISIWSLCSITNETELRRQFKAVDQGSSGSKRCLAVVIDENGSFDELFDQVKGKYQAPEKMHCPSILIRLSR